MLEFRQHADGQFQLGYGGDAFNTAVYAARLGVRVGFISAIGDDYYSEWLLQRWKQEGVDCDHVRKTSLSAPGLYVIRNNDEGERFFHYWRDATPFRHLLDETSATALIALLSNYQQIYFTGIGLALLPVDHRMLLLDCLKVYRGQGGVVVFDPNFRPVLWQSQEEALNWMDQAYACADRVFPSMDDELALREQYSDAALIEHLQSLGVQEAVIKKGALGCSVLQGGQVTSFRIAEPLQPVDTTAAGDAFNAAYLQARSSGHSVAKAVDSAQTLAAKVIMHSGAIIASELM